MSYDELKNDQKWFIEEQIRGAYRKRRKQRRKAINIIGNTMLFLLFGAAAIISGHLWIDAVGLKQLIEIIGYALIAIAWLTLAMYLISKGTE
jgi:hypothetical protein